MNLYNQYQNSNHKLKCIVELYRVKCISISILPSSKTTPFCPRDNHLWCVSITLFCIIHTHGKVLFFQISGIMVYGLFYNSLLCPPPTFNNIFWNSCIGLYRSEGLLSFNSPMLFHRTACHYLKHSPSDAHLGCCEVFTVMTSFTALKSCMHLYTNVQIFPQNSFLQNCWAKIYAYLKNERILVPSIKKLHNLHSH